MATASDFRPRVVAGLYSQPPTQLEDENRTRYLYVPFLAFVGGVIDLARDKMHVTRIPEGHIVRVKKHGYPDPNFGQDEITTVSLPAQPLTETQCVWRNKTAHAQAFDLLSRYGKNGLVELQSLQEIDEQLLPPGWNADYACDLLDGILSPPDDERAEMGSDELIEWFHTVGTGRLLEASAEPRVPNPDWFRDKRDHNLTTLPAHLYGIGEKLIEELVQSVVKCVGVQNGKVKGALDEIEKARAGDRARRGKLSETEERSFRWLDLPTPIQRQMEFENNQKQSIVQQMGDVIKQTVEAMRGPVGNVPTEDEIEARAAERARAMVADMMPEITRQVAEQLKGNKTQKKDG